MEKEPSFAPVSFRGSLTIEASWIVGILLAVFIGLFTLFDVLLLQVRIQQALNETTEQMAVGAYFKELLPDLFSRPEEGDDDDDGYSGPILLSALGDTYREFLLNGMYTGYLALSLRKDLKNDTVVERRVQNGVSGLNCAWTILHEDTEYIDARVRYTVQIWGLPKAWNRITFVQRCRRRCWIGSEPWDGQDTDGEEKDVVYITQYGEVYHEYANCSHLLRDIKTLEYAVAIGKRNEYGRRYGPCYCVGGHPNAHIYLTRAGTCYHNRKNCRALLRYIQEIERREAEGRPLCKQCERRQKEEGKED